MGVVTVVMVDGVVLVAWGWCWGVGAGGVTSGMVWEVARAVVVVAVVAGACWWLAEALLAAAWAQLWQGAGRMVRGSQHPIRDDWWCCPCQVG